MSSRPTTSATSSADERRQDRLLERARIAMRRDRAARRRRRCRHAACPRGAGHVRSEHFGTRLACAAVTTTMLAAVHHRHAIGRARGSRRGRPDEQHRLAGVARGAQLRVDELDRADVDAARRLRGEQHLKRAPHLARDDDLLLVAARERARRQRRIGRADVERARSGGARCRVIASRSSRTPRVKRCCRPRMRLSATE